MDGLVLMAFVAVILGARRCGLVSHFAHIGEQCHNFFVAQIAELAIGNQNLFWNQFENQVQIVIRSFHAQDSQDRFAMLLEIVENRLENGIGQPGAHAHWPAGVAGKEGLAAGWRSAA